MKLIKTIQSNYLDGLLVDHIKELQAIVDEHGDKVELSFDSDSYGYIEIELSRPLTEAEQNERAELVKANKAASDARRRRNYELLKKEFEG